MLLTLFKSETPNFTPGVVSYQKYKHFDCDMFRLEVSNKLSMQHPSTMDYKIFKDTYWFSEPACSFKTKIFKN